MKNLTEYWTSILRNSGTAIGVRKAWLKRKRKQAKIKKLAKTRSKFVELPGGFKRKVPSVAKLLKKGWKLPSGRVSIKKSRFDKHAGHLVVVKKKRGVSFFSKGMSKVGAPTPGEAYRFKKVKKLNTVPEFRFTGKNGRVLRAVGLLRGKMDIGMSRRHIIEGSRLIRKFGGVRTTRNSKHGK